MPQVLVHGADCNCAFGSALGKLVATASLGVNIGGKPALTAANVSITPCGMCLNPAHPAIAPVLAATGVIPPVPCTPTITKWSVPKSFPVGNHGQCLVQGATANCTYPGGVISVANPGQSKVHT